MLSRDEYLKFAKQAMKDVEEYMEWANNEVGEQRDKYLKWAEQRMGDANFYLSRAELSEALTSQ